MRAPPPASRVRQVSVSVEDRRTRAMIVLGADTHKRSHTIAAVSAATGELLGEQTVPVGAKGFAGLVVWARALGEERVWAIEDCRHVSGSFERFLIARGERVLRVTTRLMAASRRNVRDRGKSDSIDAIAVARAALREGLDALPSGHLHDLWRELVLPGSSLFYGRWAPGLRVASHGPSRRCASASPATSCAASA